MKKVNFEPCPCCDSQNWTYIWQNNNPKPLRGWRDFMYGGREFIKSIVSCENCKYSFLDPKISGDAYYLTAESSGYSTLAPARRQYFEDVKHQIEFNGFKLPNNGRILDLGSGTGEWLDAWPSIFDKSATEVNQQHIRTLKSKNINVFYDLQSINTKFSLISAFDFIEHMEDPVTILRQINSKLSDGGTALIGVPDMGKLLAKLLGVRYYLYCPMHYSNFTKIALHNILTKVFESEPIILTSPPMRAKVGSIAKWIFPVLENSFISNFWLPFGYKASLIAVVKKSKKN
jgi:SAM-dependent methyltransferase